MSGTVAQDAGYIGCNYCGIVKCFNAHKLRIAWILCKDCDFAYTRGGSSMYSRSLLLPGQRFTRKPDPGRLRGPEGGSVARSSEITYWDRCGEVMPEYRDEASREYHLLNYKPEENREMPLKVPLSTPNYEQIARMVGLPHCYYSDSDE